MPRRWIASSTTISSSTRQARCRTGAALQGQKVLLEQLESDPERTWLGTWGPLQPTEAERRFDPRVVAVNGDEVVVKYWTRGCQSGRRAIRVRGAGPVRGARWQVRQGPDVSLRHRCAERVLQPSTSGSRRWRGRTPQPPCPHVCTADTTGVGCSPDEMERHAGYGTDRAYRRVAELSPIQLPDRDDLEPGVDDSPDRGLQIVTETGRQLCATDKVAPGGAVGKIKDG